MENKIEGSRSANWNKKIIKKMKQAVKQKNHQSFKMINGGLTIQLKAFLR